MKTSFLKIRGTRIGKPGKTLGSPLWKESRGLIAPSIHRFGYLSLASYESLFGHTKI